MPFRCNGKKLSVSSWAVAGDRGVFVERMLPFLLANIADIADIG